MKVSLPCSLLLASVLVALVSSPTLAQAPPAPTTGDLHLHVVTSSCKWAKLAWTNGDGALRALVLADLTKARAESSPVPPDVAPSQGQVLFGSAYFGTSGYTRNNGFTVYTGPGTDMAVRGLVKGHEYMALLYPYNKSADTGEVTYLLSPGPDTLRFITPGCPDVSPTRQAYGLQSSPLDCSTVKLTCRPGNGQARLFVMRQSSVSYNGDVSTGQENFLLPSNLYARGFQTGNATECYSVSNGTDTTVTVYGLAPDKMHKWAVYEYNTVPGPDGLPDGVTPFYDQFQVPTAFNYVTNCTGGEPGKSSVDDKPHQTSAAAVLPGTLRTTSVGIQWHPSITPAHYQSGNSGPIVPAGQRPDDGVGSYVVIHNSLSPHSLPLPLQNTTPDALSTIYGKGSPVRPGQDSIYSVKLTYNWADTTVAITNLRPNTTYTVNVFTFRFPDAGNGLTVPYTYFLSQPQANITFTTPAVSVDPLPVRLVGFSATHRPGAASVQVNWQTAMEIHNLGFGIQRSLDGRAWTRIDFVASSTGGNSTRPQSYVSVSPFVGAAYYRLRQEDFDGTATYSLISYVREDATNTGAALAVYPNPTSGAFALVGADPARLVGVYNMLGQRVLELPAGTSTGTLAAMPAGIYVFRQDGAHALLVRH